MTLDESVDRLRSTRDASERTCRARDAWTTPGEDLPRAERSRADAVHAAAAQTRLAIRTPVRWNAFR